MHIKVLEGADQTFRFIPYSGYYLKKVTVNKTDITDDIVDMRYTILSVYTDVSLEVTYERKTVFPDEFGLNREELVLSLSGDSFETIKAMNIPDGCSVIWTVSSSDIASLAPEVGPETTVTGFMVGEVIVTAKLSGDEDVSADCTVTIMEEAPPTPSPEPIDGSSGGGCNATGTVPAMLLLLVPFVLFKR